MRSLTSPPSLVLVELLMNVKLGLSFNYIKKVRNLRVRVRLAQRTNPNNIISKFSIFLSLVKKQEVRDRQQRVDYLNATRLLSLTHPRLHLSLSPVTVNLLSLSFALHFFLICIYQVNWFSRLSSQQPFSPGSSSWLFKETLS